MAAKTRALSGAFPSHPLHDQLLNTAIALCTADVLSNATNHDECTPTADQLATVRAEFNATLQALIYLPAETRFYVIWDEAPNAAFFAAFVDLAWRGAPGEYGQNPPSHWTQRTPEPKPNPKSKPKQRKK